MVPGLSVDKARGEKVRTFRMPEGEYRAAKEVADERGEALSQVIRDALRRYITRHAPK